MHHFVRYYYSEMIARKMLTKKDNVSCDCKPNNRFCWMEWSLKPMIICLWFLGLPLRSPYYQHFCGSTSCENSKGNQPNSRWWMYIFIQIFGLLLFCINLMENCFSIYLGMKIESRRGTLGWNDTISSLNFCFGILLSHFVLITSVTFTWNEELLDVLHRIQNQFDTNTSNNDKLRRISVASSVVLLIVSYYFLFFL